MESRQRVASEALVLERAILGVYRHVGEVGQLISLLRYAGFDLRKLSLLFVDTHHGSNDPGSGRKGLRTGLLVEGARSLGGGEETEVFAAGPLAGMLLNGGGKKKWTSQGVIRALDQTLSGWGMRAGRLTIYETSIASGRCLVVLHAASEEVPYALALMRRSAAEHVTLVGGDGSSSTPTLFADGGTQ
jgi:hypothetical protein